MSEQALVKENQQQVPAHTQTSSVLSVIERAASDPNVDVVKMEKLLDMQERVLTKQQEAEFFSALNACQRGMGRIAADCDNKQTRSKYASYAALDRVLRPIYTEHELSLSFDTEPGQQAEMVRVLCYVSHTNGFTKCYSVDMPADGKGAKGGDVMTKTHATGAAMSYGMRYLLKMIFNVAIGEDDTDGNMPGDWLADVKAINEAANIDDVKARYTEAFGKWKGNKQAVADIVTAKDNMKRHFGVQQ